AGGGDEGGEEVVDADGVRQAQAVRDAEGALVGVAEVFEVAAVFGGEHGGPGGGRDVVHGGGAGGDEGLEAVQHRPAVQLAQALAGGAGRREGQRGDLSRGEHPVLVQHPEDPPVPHREPGGEGGPVLGGVRRARGGPSGLVASQGSLPGRI